MTRTEFEGFGINPHGTRAMPRRRRSTRSSRPGPKTDGLTRCTKPIGNFVNDRVAAFTMVHSPDTRKQAKEEAARSFEWNVNNNGRRVKEFSECLQGGELIAK